MTSGDPARSPRRPVKTLKVRGKKWALRFVPNLGDSAGQCDYTGMVIRIALGQKPQDELDTLVHEIIHAAYPDLEESAVAQGAEGVAEALWRLGYRRGT